MTISRMMTIGLGAATVAAVIYALSLVPSRKPAGEPPRVEAPPPAVTAAPPAAPLPSFVPPPPPQTPTVPTAPSPPEAPAPPPPAEAPTSLEALHITEAEDAAIKPIVNGAREHAQQVMKDFKAGKLTLQELDDTLKRGEADILEQLGRTLGDERARHFLRLTRGRLPESHEPPAQ
jgi:type IV secretory pathway VirB10-like protein